MTVAGCGSITSGSAANGRSTTSRRSSRPIVSAALTDLVAVQRVTIGRDSQRSLERQCEGCLRRRGLKAADITVNAGVRAGKRDVVKSVRVRRRRGGAVRACDTIFLRHLEGPQIAGKSRSANEVRHLLRAADHPG